MDDDDGKAGYRKPPAAHRFKKGKSGNPKGRPKKVMPPVETSDRLIMQRLDAEIIVIDGVPQSKREVELRILQAKALKGDLRAIKILDQKRTALKLDQPQRRTGVLRVPVAASAEQWAKDAKADQEKYRSSSYSPLAEIEAKEKAAGAKLANQGHPDGGSGAGETPHAVSPALKLSSSR